MTDEMRTSRFTGIRIELTVLTEKVVEGRQICSEQDFFRIEDIERALGGAFATSHEAIGDSLNPKFKKIISLTFKKIFIIYKYPKNT